jgi:competence protein ComGC
MKLIGPSGEKIAIHYEEVLQDVILIVPNVLLLLALPSIEKHKSKKLQKKKKKKEEKGRKMVLQQMAECVETDLRHGESSTHRISP